MTITKKAALAGLLFGAATAGFAAQPQQSSAEKLERALDRTGTNATVTELPNGTIKIELNETFQHVALARVNERGEIETLCTEHAHDVHRFMHGEPSNARITVGEPR